MARRATLITDASYCCPGVSGWAAWCRVDGCEADRWAGKIRARWISSNNEAELCAVAVALYKISDRHGTNLSVMVQSDNWRTLNLLCTRLGAVDVPHSDDGVSASRGFVAQETEAEARLLQAITDAGFPRLNVRHVRGHASGPQLPGRNGANNRCDEVARDQQRELRLELLESGALRKGSRGYVWRSALGGG